MGENFNNLRSFGDWGDIFVASMQNLWFNIASFLPQLLSALVILIAGLIIASLAGKIVKKIVGYLRIDTLMQKVKVKEELEKLGLKFEFGVIAGKIVKWFFIVATLIAVADVLRIPQVTRFLEKVVLYLPNVLVAVVILAIGIIMAGWAYETIKQGTETFKMSSYVSQLLASIAKWSILVFAVMAALVQLGVADDMIRILFTGLVVMVSLAGGLAFGLGGKTKAEEVINRMTGRHQ
ncbi:MAG: mechanosensitive ion channel family protein [Patescibacteria group bacterium]